MESALPIFPRPITTKSTSRAAILITILRHSRIERGISRISAFFSVLISQSLSQQTTQIGLFSIRLLIIQPHESQIFLAPVYY
jgi:hypothetical protein